MDELLFDDRRGPWNRTPWWVFWRPQWRRRIWKWHPFDNVDEPGWRIASPADFILM